MTERCPHPGVVRTDVPRMSANGPPARIVWACQACGVTWPADPRQHADSADGLADRITAAIHTAGESTPPAEILGLLVDMHRRARDLFEVSLLDTGGADLDMDSFDAGIQYGAAATLQVLADHGLIRDDENGPST